MAGAARRSESVLSGEYKSSFRGKGMEFDQVVKYEYGDDVRDIDWNVTARLGEPYRKNSLKSVRLHSYCCLKIPLPPVRVWRTIQARSPS